MSDYMDLVSRHGALMEELIKVRRQMAAHHPRGPEYRIALRPDDRGADPMDHRTRLDDIVVNDVAMFRAEQMDVSTWWVACYLNNDTHDRICWNVSASARPKRIDWTGYEYPDEPVVYEHELRATTDA